MGQSDEAQVRELEVALDRAMEARAKIQLMTIEVERKLDAYDRARKGVPKALAKNALRKAYDNFSAHLWAQLETSVDFNDALKSSSREFHSAELSQRIREYEELGYPCWMCKRGCGRCSQGSERRAVLATCPGGQPRLATSVGTAPLDRFPAPLGRQIPTAALLYQYQSATN